MDRIVLQARVAAKAIVAAVTPILVALIGDVFVELSAVSTGVVAAVATAVVVWLTPNKQVVKPGSSG